MKHNSSNEKKFLVSLSFFGKRSRVFVFLLCFCSISGQLYDKNNTLNITTGTTVYVSDSVVSVTKAEKPKIYIAGNAKVYGLDNAEKIRLELPYENIKDNSSKALAKVTEEKIEKQNTAPKTANIKNGVKISALPTEHFANYSASKISCIAPTINQQVKDHFADNIIYRNLKHYIYYKRNTKTYNHFSVLQQGFEKNYRCRPPPVV